MRRHHAVFLVVAIATLFALSACAPAYGGGGGGDYSSVVGGIAAIPNGGSSAWDDGVKPILLANFDQDRSGQLDTPSEVHAIPCSVWQILHRRIQDTHIGLRTTYGFARGYGWVGSALGFSERVRYDADSDMAACGVQPGE